MPEAVPLDVDELDKGAPGIPQNAFAQDSVGGEHRIDGKLHLHQAPQRSIRPLAKRAMSAMFTSGPRGLSNASMDRSACKAAPRAGPHPRATVSSSSPVTG